MRRPRGLRTDIPGLAQHGPPGSFRAPPPRGPQREAGPPPSSRGSSRPLRPRECGPPSPMARGAIPLFLMPGPARCPLHLGPAFLPFLIQARFPGSDSEGSAPSPSPRPALVRFSLLSLLFHLFLVGHTLLSAFPSCRLTPNTLFVGESPA